MLSAPLPGEQLAASLQSVSLALRVQLVAIIALCPCQDAGLEWHKQSSHGHRLTTVTGNSQKTVAEYAKKHPELKCDLVHIDGAHISPAV